MKQHHTWFGKLLASIFGKGLKGMAAAAVTVTEEFKTLMAGGFVKGIADFLDTTLKSQLPSNLVDAINKTVPHVLAVELAIQGIPDNPTEDDIKNFEDSVYKAITGLTPDGNSKLYTTLAAQIYAILKPQIDAGHITFAQLVADVEEAYQDYIKDKADNGN